MKSNFKKISYGNISLTSS